ncbi:hypothetical protein ACFL0O_00290 [Thermodesulfobacteriota bacterium]
MFDLRKSKPPMKLYGNVKRGWHRAEIHQAGIKNGRSKKGKEYQYILIDFLITKDDVLVPFFSFYKKGQERPDPAFAKLLSIAGVTGDFSNDQFGLFDALLGSELMVRVTHRFKGPNRIRRDAVTDFRYLREPGVDDDKPPF